MSSINNRMRRLEEIAGAGVGCPECTNTPSGSLGLAEPRPAEEEARLQRDGVLYCPACGRITVFTFKFGTGTSHEIAGAEGEELP